MAAEDMESLLRAARTCLRRQEYSEARKLYLQIVNLDARSIPGYEGLAMAHFALGDYADASAAFQKLALLEPLEARHYVNLGAVYNRAGQYPQAVEALRKAIQRDRRQAEAYYNLGIAHRKQQQMSLAVSAYKEAIRLNPQMAEAYQNLGNVYAQMKNHPLAISNFQKALDIDPDFERARIGLDKAQEAVQKSKMTPNPQALFAMPDASSMRLPRTENVELSATERLIDRQTVCRLSDEITALVETNTLQLHTQLEPAILDLERAVAEGDCTTPHFHRAMAYLVDVLEEWRRQRTLLQQKFRELEDHEVTVATPGALRQRSLN